MKQDSDVRDDYRWFFGLPTRWADNDVYGHVNNVAYYGFFDTAVNRFLIERAKLDIHKGAQIGLVVETGCRYFAPLSFPAQLDIGVRADHIGNSSITYGLGVFDKGKEISSAQGTFTHVYVDRATRRPMPLSADLRRAAAGISVAGKAGGEI